MAALIWKWACTTHTVWLVIFARYLFLRFSWVKSHSRKLKPQKLKLQKFCCPRVKRTNCVSIPGLVLYSSLQKRVSECAFNGYHWSNPKCYVNTDARSRQRRKAESGSNRRGSQIHRSWKLKLRKFSEIGILVYFAKICTRENYQPYGILQFKGDPEPKLRDFENISFILLVSWSWTVRGAFSTL